MIKTTAMFASLAPPLVIFSFFTLLNYDSSAQQFYSARSLSVNHGGIIGARSPDIFQTPALGDTGSTTLFSTVRNDYHLPDISYGNVGLVFSRGRQLIGIGLSTFGIGDYRLNQADIALSKTVHQHIVVGCAISYGRTRIMEFRSGAYLYFTAAGRFVISPLISLGLRISHRVDEQQSQNEVSQVSIQYTPDVPWILSLDLRKTASQKPYFIGAVEYIVHERIKGRFSFTTHQHIACGVVFSLSRLVVDVGVKHLPYLGLSTGITLSYRIRT